MYTDLQKRDIAREIARAGGNVAAAQRRLRDEYEFFRTIGVSTIRRLMAEEGFSELVGQEHAKIAEARSEEARARERDIAREAYTASAIQRQRRDATIFDEARAHLERLIKEPEKVDLNVALRAFEIFARIEHQRSQQLAPAIAEMEEAIVLVESVQETIVAEFGPQKAPLITKKIRERYQEKLAARAAVRQQVSPAAQ